MTPERIAVEVSAAIDKAKQRMVSEGRMYPAPLAFTKCRWCGTQLVASATMQWWVRVGFCSRGCVQERYDEDGRHE